MGVLLYPQGCFPDKVFLPEQTVEDLQLERLAIAMSYSNYYKITAAELNELLTRNAEVITHRQAVMADLINNPELEAALDKLLGCIDGWETRSGGIRRGLDTLAVGLNLEDFSFLDSYLSKINAVYNELCSIKVKSEGLKKLIAKISDMRRSERFEGLKKSFEELCAGYVSPFKMRLGYNLDRELKPSKLKLLYMEPYTGEEADKKSKKRRLMLNQRAVIVNTMLLQRSVSGISQAISGFVTRETMELRLIKKDLIFYLSALKLLKLWKAGGLKCCFPEIRPDELKAFSTKGMFNPLLVINGRESIITNDIEFSEGGEILILTGANQGGKTVFLLSAALTQWFFQLGFMVPCEEAKLSTAGEILTVFAPNKDSYGKKGLLSEEAGRIAAAVKAVSGDSLVFFNEPLTSTSPSETREISQEVIAAFKAAGVRGVWVTHVYELASRRGELERFIPWGSKIGSAKIIMKSGENGGISSFTYKIERGEPEFYSYASEVLRRKGVSLSAKR
jgi:DNA mismatch repair ATPase MutS